MPCRLYTNRAAKINSSNGALLIYDISDQEGYNGQIFIF